MKKNYNRNAELMFPLCGGKTFESENELKNTPVKCISCKREYCKQELSLLSKIISISVHIIRQTVSILHSEYPGIFYTHISGSCSCLLPLR
jgi:hypothetical protein